MAKLRKPTGEGDRALGRHDAERHRRRACRVLRFGDFRRSFAVFVAIRFVFFVIRFASSTEDMTEISALEARQDKHIQQAVD